MAGSDWSRVTGILAAADVASPPAVDWLYEEKFVGTCKLDNLWEIHAQALETWEKKRWW